MSNTKNLYKRHNNWDGAAGGFWKMARLQVLEKFPGTSIGVCGCAVRKEGVSKDACQANLDIYVDP